MADEFSLRCYCFLDRMQAQYAAFVGTITQGDLPIEGMAALYVEMAPGNEVFRVVDIAVKATEARPGAQIVEREFGMFEVHSPNQAAVIEAGEVVLERLGLRVEDRIRPQVASTQVITRIDPYQAQLINRFRRGSMLVPVSSVGRFGRMWLSGSEAEIQTAKNAAIQALESLSGREGA